MKINNFKMNLIKLISDQQNNIYWSIVLQKKNLNSKKKINLKNIF